MKNKKSAILAGFLATAMAEQERKDFYEFTNPYAGMEDVIHYTGPKVGERKTPLTKKQKKNRAKAKAAKQARKRNRK